MIVVKTPEEIDLMREGGKKLSHILEALLAAAKPDVMLTKIETLANTLVADAGGTPSFKTVKGYQWATCLCVNDVVVHGIPTSYSLKDGDIFTIDVGMFYKGFHTDTAWTNIVKSDKRPPWRTGQGQVISEKEEFLQTGQEALWRAIAQAKAGNRVGHISQAIQTTIEGAGFSVVKTLVGHGVGRQLHEAPQIPGFVKGRIEDTLPLEEGMTLAIEVIYAQGAGVVVYKNDDGWTIATKDQSLAAVFEHTISIASSGPEVLTKA